MKIVQQTFPTTLPVELELIKSQLRIDGTDEDILISNRVKSAQSFIEQYTNRCLLSSTFIAYLDSYPETELWIYKFPITAITAVKYYNSAGTLTPMTDGTDYVYSIKDCPTKVKFLTTPAIQTDIYDGIEIHFTAGHADLEDIDKGIIEALNLIVGSFNENRQNESSFNVNEIPLNYKNLLNMYVKGTYL